MNEGIRSTGKNGLVFGLVAGLVFAFGVTFAGTVGGQIVGWSMGPIAGLAEGLGIGLLVGHAAYAKHFILRFFLSRQDNLPWNLVPFLDEAAERLLLRKVGGGYMFVHRLLRDYFISLDVSTSSGSTFSENQTEEENTHA